MNIRPLRGSFVQGYVKGYLESPSDPLKRGSLPKIMVGHGPVFISVLRESPGMYLGTFGLWEEDVGYSGLPP